MPPGLPHAARCGTGATRANHNIDACAFVLGTTNGFCAALVHLCKVYTPYTHTCTYAGTRSSWIVGAGEESGEDLLWLSPGVRDLRLPAALTS